MDPTRLSDADLEAELRMRAQDRDCELVVEREGSHWRAGFKDSSAAGLHGTVLTAEGPGRRAALERLLQLAEDRA